MRRFLAAALAGVGVLHFVLPNSLSLFADGPAPMPPMAVTPRSELPLADPVIDSQVELKSRRATSWTDGSAKILYLEGEFSLAVGTYGFRGERAVVRMDREEKPGKVIRHISIYIDDAKPLRGRGPVTAQSPRLLVTVSTTGAVDLVTDLLRKETVAGDAFITEAGGRFREYLAKISQPTRDVPEGAPIMTPEMIARRDAMRAQIAVDSRRNTEASLAARNANRGTQGGPPGAAPATQPSIAAAPSDATTQPAATQPGMTAIAPDSATPTTQPVATGDAPRPIAPVVAATTRPSSSAPGSAPTAKVIAPSSSEGPRSGAATPDRIFAEKGVVIFGTDRVAFQQGNQGENVLMLMGNVRILYKSYDGSPDATLTASNAVIFLSGGDPLAQAADRQAGVRDIKGIYLEDNVVATYDQYTVRAPRVYYDLTHNRAIVLDAVMFGYDVQRKIPIYIRAEKMRQESATTWSAQNAALTNSEFGLPHFSIAARTLTFKQEKREDGSMAGPFTAKGITPKWGRTPMFYWPYLAGDANQNIPLRKATFGYSSQDGANIQTTWDLFALAGNPKPSGVDLTGDLDYRGRHGVGLGVNLDYDRPRQFGLFDAYFLPYDTGTDEIGGRQDVGHDGDARGFTLWRHRQILPQNWDVSLEFAYVSDETFLEEFFRQQADTSKTYETSVYLKKQEEDWAFTFLGKYDINEFVTQTPALQAPGYNVDKLPELGYYRVATSLWDDRLTYYTENRLGLMRLRPGEDSPGDRGFSESQSQLLFGIPRTTTFEDAFDDAGLPSDYVSRFDSRHEFQAPLKAGPIDLVPYLTGRFTGYDDDFGDYSDEAEQMRLWGAAGVRLGTSFSNAFSNIENRTLDLHRLRHIIEPTADLFMAASSVDPESYPVYDPDVEGINEGGGARLGVRNTLQTQRGGPGRWRNVDWLVVNTDLILRSDDVDDERSIARFISYRPEYSLGGDHFHADVMWLVTDSLAVVGEVIQNLEDHFLAQWRAGIQLQHSPELATFVDYTEIEDLDERLLTYGFSYQLSRKYAVRFSQTLDFSESESRSLNVGVTRKLPRWTMMVFSSYDQIDDETTFGVVLFPDGLVNVRPPQLFTTDRDRR